MLVPGNRLINLAVLVVLSIARLGNGGLSFIRVVSCGGSNFMEEIDGYF
jgi:hypothetical protein